MYDLPIQAIVHHMVEVWRAIAVALWDAVAAEPKLQLILVGVVALTVLGGGARGRSKPAR